MEGAVRLLYPLTTPVLPGPRAHAFIAERRVVGKLVAISPMPAPVRPFTFPSRRLVVVIRLRPSAPTEVLNLGRLRRDKLLHAMWPLVLATLHQAAACLLASSRVRATFAGHHAALLHLHGLLLHWPLRHLLAHVGTHHDCH